MTDAAPPSPQKSANLAEQSSHQNQLEACPALTAYLSGTPEEKALGEFSVLDQDGKASPENIRFLSKELARNLYGGMLRIRVVDARLMKLQRQGRIGFYGEALGQEAAVVGSAAALKQEDWFIPALREAGGGLYRGMSLSSYVAQIMGTVADNCKGRQMPCHPCDPKTNYVVMSSCVSSQVPHAVGIAMAMKLTEAKEVCMGFMGDGGTSEGDFHVSLNFAGVMKSPVVLICQNNQWAISTPGHRQTASPTIAIKGLGYGLESLRVDGNDVLACYLAAKYAVDKARAGGGATFLELLTYRVGAHSSSDDPSQYRDESHTTDWRENRDPLVRMETLLDRGLMSKDEREKLRTKFETEINEVVSEQEAAGLPDVKTLIEDVFETPHWRLRDQMSEYLKEEEQYGD